MTLRRVKESVLKTWRIPFDREGRFCPWLLVSPLDGVGTSLPCILMEVRWNPLNKQRFGLFDVFAFAKYCFYSVFRRDFGQSTMPWPWEVVALSFRVVPTFSRFRHLVCLVWKPTLYINHLSQTVFLLKCFHSLQFQPFGTYVFHYKFPFWSFL